MPICSWFAVHHVDTLSLSSRSWANSLILTIKTALRGLLTTWILVLTLFGLLGGPKLTQDFYWGQHSASLNILGRNFRWALGKIHVCKVCLKWEAWNGWKGRNSKQVKSVLHLISPRAFLAISSISFTHVLHSPAILALSLRHPPVVHCLQVEVRLSLLPILTSPSNHPNPPLPHHYQNILSMSLFKLAQVRTSRLSRICITQEEGVSKHHASYFVCSTQFESQSPSLYHHGYNHNSSHPHLWQGPVCLLLSPTPWTIAPKCIPPKCKSEPTFLHHHFLSSGLSVKAVPMSPAIILFSVSALLQIMGFLLVLKNNEHGLPAKPLSLLFPLPQNLMSFSHLRTLLRSTWPMGQSLSSGLWNVPSPTAVSVFSVRFYCIHTKDNHLSRYMFSIFLSYFDDCFFPPFLEHLLHQGRTYSLFCLECISNTWNPVWCTRDKGRFVSHWVSVWIDDSRRNAERPRPRTKDTSQTKMSWPPHSLSILSSLSNSGRGSIPSLEVVISR